jgi:hypothetical protein
MARGDDANSKHLLLAVVRLAVVSTLRELLLDQERGLASPLVVFCIGIV